MFRLIAITSLKIDRSIPISMDIGNIVTIIFISRTYPPRTRLQIKIAFNFRLTSENTSFHELDCTSGQDARITVGANGVDLINKIDITKIVIKLSIKIT